MSQFPLSAYERPSLAMSNLLTGDFEAVGRSLVAPSTLSPTELKRLQDKFGDGKKHHPIIQTILDVSTNPLFLMTVGLSMAMPPATPAKIIAMGKSLQAKVKKPMAVWDRLRPPRHIVGDRVWSIMKRIWDGTVGPQFEFDHRMFQAYKEHKKAVGHYPTQTELVTAMVKTGGLDSKDGWDFRGMQQAGVPVNAPLLKPIPKTKSVEILSGAYKEALGKWFDRTNKLVKNNPKLREGFEQSMKARSYDPDELTVAGRAQLGVKLRHYIPRFAFYPARTVREKAADTIGAEKQGVSARAEYSRRLFRAANRQLSMRFKAREGGVSMVPDFEMLEKHVPQYINRGTESSLKAWLSQKRERVINDVLAAMGGGSKLRAGWQTKFQRSLQNMGYSYEASERLMGQLRSGLYTGKVSNVRKWLNDYVDWKGNVPIYSLDPSILPRYVRSVANEYVWTLQGEGQRLQAATQKMDPARKSLMKEIYFPLLRGAKTYEQAQQSLAWGDTVLKAADKLKSPGLRKAAAAVPGGAKSLDWLYGKLTSPRSMQSGIVGGGLAGWFYMSTLGFNVSPALKNLLQPVITTYPMVGGKALGRGFVRTVGGLKKYASSKMKGKAHFEAMAEAFPGFHKEFRGLYAPLTEQMIHGGIGGEVPGGPVHRMSTKVGPAWEKFKKATMSVFSGSELFNRLLTYYSGQAWAKAGGLKSKVANEMASRLVYETQFAAGPLGMPPALVNIPPPARQFAYFPLRYLGFLGAPKEIGGGVGTVSRAAAASIAGGTLARNLLGVDLEPGLMLSAMPLPQYPWSPFYPFPIVPPVFSVVGTAAEALAQGKTEGLGPTAGLLVPGGIAARKWIKSLQWMKAGYKHRNPDGTIPIYSDEGFLVQNATPMQLVMKSIGLYPRDLEAERGLTQYLLKNRERIRTYRRKYLEALYNNDQDKARKIQESFKKDYPEMGELRVKKSDIDALEQRKMTTRLGRIMKGFRKSDREPFEKIVNLALGTDLALRLEEAPESLELLVSPAQATPAPVGPSSSTPLGNLGWGLPPAPGLTDMPGF